MRELPQGVTVQCTFKPIHDILPRRQTPKDPIVPLIVNTEENFLANEILAADDVTLTKAPSAVNRNEVTQATAPTTLRGNQNLLASIDAPPAPKIARKKATIIIPDPPLGKATGYDPTLPSWFGTGTPGYINRVTGGVRR